MKFFALINVTIQFKFSIAFYKITADCNNSNFLTVEYMVLGN